MTSKLIVILSFFLCIVAKPQATGLKAYNSSTDVDIKNFPLGTTIVLECTFSELPPLAQYKWTCPHGTCENNYRKVYNNVIVLVVTNTTTTTSGERYQCTLEYENETTIVATFITPLSSQTLDKGE